MSNDKILSVIIPVYNGKQYLINCVKSILESSYENLEVILVDDGSEEETRILCDKIAKDDARVLVFHKENGGIVSARNYGLEMAKGEYIAFSDQDDRTDKFMYEKCIKRMEKDCTDLCICECDKLCNNSYKKFISIKENCIIQGTQKIKSEIILPLLCRCNRMKIHFETGLENICENYYGFIWNAVYKRKIIKNNKIKFVKYVDYEDDHLFVLDYLKNCTAISFEKYKGYFWRIYKTSTSHSTKFVDDIAEKREKLTNHYISILEQCIKKDDLGIYKKELYIRDMIQIIENETLFVNLRKDKENIQYLNKVFQKNIVEKNINLKSKDSFNWKAFRDEYMRYCLGKHSMKYIYYIDKYLYNKFLVHIKNIIKK